mgnify:CR=1 FL=1
MWRKPCRCAVSSSGEDLLSKWQATSLSIHHITHCRVHHPAFLPLLTLQEVIKPMNFPSKVNTAAIRKIYSQLLWHFEQVYFNDAAGQPLAEPPELAAATAAAAAVQAAAADRSYGFGSAAVADGGGRARPARSRKGPSLAALIAAEDQFGSGFEESLADDQEGESDEDPGSEGGDPAAAGPSGSVPAAVPAASGGPAEPAAVVRKAAAAAPAAGGSPAPSAAAANGTPAAAAAAPARQRSRPQPQQQRGSGPAPGKTPELTAFMKSGRHRRDLTGAPVTGRVEARFDCGYFVSISVGGLQFGGVLYCPTGTGTAAAGGAGGQQGGSRAAGVKREDSAAAEGVNGVRGRPPAGSSVKREAGAAGFEEGGGGGGGRAAKRRRSNRDANDPALANKPKSAKVGVA